MTRLAVLGGSSISTPGLVLALRGVPLKEDVNLVLYGRSEDKLTVVTRACKAAARGSRLTIDSTTSLPTCLEEVDIILNQVRIGGLEARRFDENFPPELGLIGEETMGAGGFSNALRTIPAVLGMCEVVQRYAPNATLVNLTNPASLVHQALERYTNLRVVSVCDIPVKLAGWVRQALDCRNGPLELEYLGMNHVGWVTSARVRPTGSQDRLHDVLNKWETISGVPFDAEWVRSLGVIPSPYLRYLYQPDRHTSSSGARTRADALLDVEAYAVDAYRSLAGGAGPEDVTRILAKRSPHWYSEIIAPLLVALRETSSQRLIVQTTNNGRIPWLPAHCVIEIPSCVSRSGVDPEGPPEIPRDCQALLVQNAAYEELAVEAIVEGDRGMATRALTVNPLVGSVDAARAVLDAVWV